MDPQRGISLECQKKTFFRYLHVNICGIRGHAASKKAAFPLVEVKKK